MSRTDRKGTLLGVIAYLAVPGERRRRAVPYFRRAGIEAAKGVAALVRPESPPQRAENERQQIEIL